MAQSVAMLLTILIEAPLAFALVRLLGWGKGSQTAGAAAVGVAATHVLAWPAILRLEAAITYFAAVALVETAVWLAKSVVFRLLARLPWRRSLLLAFAVNTASTAAGLLYYAIAF
jgi:uncharacterized membrane protein